MNDVLARTIHMPWRRRSMLKRLLWSASKPCSLNGLFPWPFEENWLRLERHQMPLPHLGQAFHGATIAQISDLHCSPIVLARYLRQCVEAINRMQVDFVAITGDFITGPSSFARKVAGVLKNLHPKIATVACLGNHDYGLFHPSGLGSMRNLDHLLTEELRRADVFVMRNESLVFRRDSDEVQFVGLEDLWSPGFRPRQAFELARPDLPTIALCHNPDAAEVVSRMGAHWILAGHTHGTPKKGGTLGRRLMPTKHKRYAAGKYTLQDGSMLYVNRGLSYGRRVNLNARPEITLFELAPVDALAVAI